MRKLAGILGVGVLAASLAPSVPQAHAQSSRAIQEVQCSRTVLHFTERGFAFECGDRKNENFFIFVVNAGQGYDRVGEVVSALREFNSRTPTAAGRTRDMRGLWVKYRGGGGPAQAICQEIWQRMSSKAQCKIAVDIGFR